jgi:putative tryptophan/tyrosine transport system substrate-binding protein
MPFDQLKRRQFVALLGGAAAWPLAARAQQPAMPVIGALSTISLDAPTGRIHFSAFEEGLTQTGFVKGRNLVIEYRSADGQNDRLPALAAELVRRQVGVLFANPAAAALAAKRATATIPIVFLVGGDPVDLGLVASLNRPGANATGVSFLATKLLAKRLELLSEVVPAAAMLGMLVDKTNPNAAADTKDVQATAAALGRKLFVMNASVESELDMAFAAFVQQRVAAVLITANANFDNWRDKLVALAARHVIPASYPASFYVTAGGLMSYGTNLPAMYRLVGAYAGRILKGTKPSDLPVEQSDRFEFAINLKTAKTLGIEFSAKLLALADEVIE